MESLLRSTALRSSQNSVRDPGTSLVRYQLKKKRFHVNATKTEHHESGGDRVVPSFPEVRKVLNELWDELGHKPGEFVLPHIRSISNVNPQLGRIIKNAGLKAWPKRWHNLRATRATELEREFSSHVVTGWCGHTERIAEEHYWMTTEDDFERASTLSSGANMVQQGGVTEGKQQKPIESVQKKSPEKPGSAKSCTVVRKTSVEDNGLEPGNENTGKSADTQGCAALALHWSELRGLIERCSGLSDEARESLIELGDDAVGT
jgi:hypothetical protein